VLSNGFPLKRRADRRIQIERLLGRRRPRV